jgi:hypothetical protein
VDASFYDVVSLAYTSTPAGSPADGTNRRRVPTLLGPSPFAHELPFQYWKVPFVVVALD